MEKTKFIGVRFEIIRPRELTTEVVAALNKGIKNANFYFNGKYATFEVFKRIDGAVVGTVKTTEDAAVAINLILSEVVLKAPFRTVLGRGDDENAAEKAAIDAMNELKEVPHDIFGIAQDDVFMDCDDAFNNAEDELNWKDFRDMDVAVVVLSQMFEFTFG